MIFRRTDSTPSSPIRAGASRRRPQPGTGNNLWNPARSLFYNSIPESAKLPVPLPGPDGQSVQDRVIGIAFCGARAPRTSVRASRTDQMEDRYMDLSRKTVLSLAAGALLLALLITAASGQKDPPRFMVRNTTADLGDFYEGVDIEYEFKVRNTGAAELHILGVRPG